MHVCVYVIVFVRTCTLLSTVLCYERTAVYLCIVLILTSKCFHSACKNTVDFIHSVTFVWYVSDI